MYFFKNIIFKIKKHQNVVLLIASIFMMSGCSSLDSSTGSYTSTMVYKKPLFSKIMKKSMKYEGVARNPIIFIPGFLGSRLENAVTGQNVWGNFTGMNAMDGYSNQQLSALSYPMEYGTPLIDIKSEAVPVALLEKVDVRLMGITFQFNAYSEIMRILALGGYVKEGGIIPKDKHFYSLFVFYYDWRQDLVQNAVRLHQFILSRKHYLQKEYEKLYGVKDYDVQFDFVAHSMGGLLARYYLRYGNQDLPQDGSLPVFDWRGSKNVDKVAIIGTPNAGYLDAFLQLINGFSPDPSVKPYPPAVVGTFASYYQMLPLLYTRSVLYEDELGTEQVDIFDLKNWITHKWGLADPGQDKFLKVLLPKVKTAKERRKIALDHLKKCLKRAKQLTEALQLYKYPPKGVELFLFFGNAVKTRRTAVVDRKTGKVKVTEYDAGDGVVLTSSALCDKREGQKWQPFFVSPIAWHSVFPLMAAHMGITESYAFADDLAYCLLLVPIDI